MPARQPTALVYALIVSAAASAWAAEAAPSDKELPAGARRLKAAFPDVRFETRRGHVTAFYGAPMISAASPAAAVDAWWETYGDAFGIDRLQLELAWTSTSTTDKFTFNGYRQLMDDLPVELSIARVLVLNGDPF